MQQVVYKLLLKIMPYWAFFIIKKSQNKVVTKGRANTGWELP